MRRHISVLLNIAERKIQQAPEILIKTTPQKVKCIKEIVWRKETAALKDKTWWRKMSSTGNSRKDQNKRSEKGFVVKSFEICQGKSWEKYPKHHMD